MSDKKHPHDGCNGHHDHHDHHHDTGEGFVARVKSGFNRRFRESKLDVVDEHGHTHTVAFTTKNKVGAGVVAGVALGAAIHGGVNIMRGITGYEDSLKEKHDPSVLTAAVGTGEVVGGSMLLLRALTGRWRG